MGILSMDREQFTFYSSFFQAVSRIKNKAARCDAYDAICSYALTGAMPDLDHLHDSAAIAFVLVKPNLDSSRRKAEGGKAGSNGKDSGKTPKRELEDTWKKHGTIGNGKDARNEKEKEEEKEEEKEVENECLSISGGGGEEARAREEVNQFCLGRDLEPDAYFGMTGEIREDVATFTGVLFDQFTSRKPTKVDEAQVFQAICERQDDGQKYRVIVSRDRKELLMYAFENAAAAGKAGDWKYIGGILGRLWQRGICTLGEAEEYDINRGRG